MAEQGGIAIAVADIDARSAVVAWAVNDDRSVPAFFVPV